jgi:hypothetical protein
MGKALPSIKWPNQPGGFPLNSSFYYSLHLIIYQYPTFALTDPSLNAKKARSGNLPAGFLFIHKWLLAWNCCVGLFILLAWLIPYGDGTRGKA